MLIAMAVVIAGAVNEVERQVEEMKRNPTCGGLGCMQCLQGRRGVCEYCIVSEDPPVSEDAPEWFLQPEMQEPTDVFLTSS